MSAAAVAAIAAASSCPCCGDPWPTWAVLAVLAFGVGFLAWALLGWLSDLRAWLRDRRERRR